MLKKIKQNLEKIIQKVYIFFSKKAEKQNIKNHKRKCLYKNFYLTKEQKLQVQKFYKENYGKKIPLFWHRYYFTFTKKFDYKIFPDLLFIPVLEKKLNNAAYIKSIEDKNNVNLFFSEIKGVRFPTTYISKVNGFFRDNEFNIISNETALNIFINLGKSFVKPSVGSDSGKNCQIINFNQVYLERGKTSFAELINSLGSNFIVQEVINTSDDIKKLNPSSVNTFRVMSVLLKNSQIFISPIIMRIGVGDSIVDNAHAGGIFVGVDNNGFLQRTAFTEFGLSYTKHPTSGISFDKYKIDNFSKIITVTKLLHSRIPQIRIASWDFTIDTNGNLVLIEVNLKGQSIWLHQIAWGNGVFGEYTSDLLKEIRLKRK